MLKSISSSAVHPVAVQHYRLHSRFLPSHVGNFFLHESEVSLVPTILKVFRLPASRCVCKQFLFLTTVPSVCRCLLLPTWALTSASRWVRCADSLLKPLGVQHPAAGCCTPSPSLSRLSFYFLLGDTAAVPDCTYPSSFGGMPTFLAHGMTVILDCLEREEEKYCIFLLPSC